MPGTGFTLAAVATALALGVAGCGGSDSGGSSTPSGGGAAKSGAATGSTVKLGLINPTGAFVSNPDINAGALAAVRALNARGGLAGHKVELDICNDKADATLAAKCARQMVTDKVVAMVAEMGINDQNSEPIIAAAGIPAILQRGSAASVLNGANVYLPVGGTPLAYPVMAGYLSKKLGIPYSFMISDSPNAVPLRKSLLERFKAAGASPVSDQKVNPQQADWAPIVSAAQKGGAKGVIAVLPFQQTALFVQTAASAGSPFQYTAANAIVSSPKAFGGAANLDHVFSVTAMPPMNADIPGAQQFTKELKAEADAGTDGAGADEQTGNGFAAWACVIALEEAIKQTKTTDITPAGIKKAMDSAKLLQLGGVIPPWTPTAPGPAAMSRLSNDAYYIVGYKNGAPYLITPKPVTGDDALAGKF
jgi:ABC-type branched-subunit amino acid transport system substrate-binding protein